MDNQASHLTYNFIKYAEENNILLYSLPPHTTHILQPLDGKPFQQYKHYHGMEVNNAARLGYSSFEKQEFLQFLPKIQNYAFKSQTVQSGFSDCGIYPFNPEPILETLDSQTAPLPAMEWWGEDTEEKSSNSTLPSSQGSSPKSLRQLRQSINQAQKALGKIENSLDNISPKLGGHIQKIFSGSLVQAELNAQREQDLEAYQAAAKHRNAPKSCQQVPGLSSSGVLTVKDANRQIEARKADEILKDRRRISRDIEASKANKSQPPPQTPNKTPRPDSLVNPLSNEHKEGLYWIDLTPSFGG